MGEFRTLDDVDIAGKRVLIRIDINVPIADGRVTDDTRMKAIAPTVREVLAKGGKPILLAHRGRPGGRRDPELSLELLRLPLSNALEAPVTFGEDTGYRSALEWVDALEPGGVLLLENVRFYPGEETNSPEIIESLANLGDIYVNDAFSASHRAHASTFGIAQRMPAVAGRLMEAELNSLEQALTSPERPVVAVVGGAKISTKLDLLANLSKNVEYIVIGGGMANTFLAATGHNVGKSLCEYDLVDTAQGIITAAEQAGCELVLPKDVVVAWEFAENTPHKTVSVENCPEDAMILDAGPRTVADITHLFKTARTIVWNGPLGAFEIPPFNAATDAAALQAAELAAAGRALVVAGGGDTVAALNSTGAAHLFSYVSTAGGAFLEWLEGKTLPGVAALKSQNMEDV